MAPGVMYRQLDAARIVATAEALAARVSARFPEAGLAAVAGELARVAALTDARVVALRAPRRGLRLAIGATVACLCLVVVLLASQVRVPASLRDLREVVQILESGINDVVFFGVALWFLVSTESRLKRRAALRALHELRSLAHIIDMHQLTKDPDRHLRAGGDTPASPARTMSPTELGRYLDYCSEMLSVTSKVAALYAQHLEDSVVLAAVNEVEALASGLSSKIWQKLVILQTSIRYSIQ